MRSPARIAASLLLVAVGVTSCSDDKGVDVLDTFATLPLPTGVDATAAPTTTDTALAPGVAGLDDPNPFCAAWARYSGSFQLLGVAQSFGAMPSDQVAVLEMFASPVVRAAVDAIAEEWPTELAGERAAAVDDFLGPFGRRADKAIADLRAAGATDAQIVQLSDAWLNVLATRDPLNPAIERPALDPALDAIVGTAAEVFDANVTPFSDDPSLRVGDVVIPNTNTYLAATCPALASNGVGDAV